jgi:tetraacyldisaccharide 4'-kinase
MSALAVAARNAFYNGGVLRTRRLGGPVVSVGNISVGGSGKTPFVMLMGELLKARGISFDVLSRGYGRNTRGVRLVDPAGTAGEFGDEPLLLARKLGVPVVVGERRHQAGLLAEREFGPRLHLLDDGFQHRQLARDFDIVLLTSEDVNGRLLPRGRLREPLASLRRADAVVLTRGATADGLPVETGRTWIARRGVRMEVAPLRPLVFCAIARPHAFFDELRHSGVKPVAERVFRDHHRYSSDDVSGLLALAEERGATGFVTTEKDVINLGDLALSLESLTVAHVTMQLEDANRLLDTMLAKLAARGSGWGDSVHSTLNSGKD